MRIVKLQPEIMLRDLTDVRFIDRPLGVYEGTQEVLVGPNHSCFTNFGCAASLRARFSGSTVYLYVVLVAIITSLFSEFIIN